VDVAQEKGLTAVSVQDITERANIHRGTFYTHYEDKYALVYSLIREEIQHILSGKLPPVPQWDRWTLRLLICTILENFKSVHCQCQPSAILDPLIERATREVLTEFLTVWLSQRKQAHWKIPPETMAQLMSWTIFGAAVQWSQETTRTAEQVANDVLLMITEGLTHLAPDALLD
jgi:AcrR family transcriptional regulator